MALVARPEQRSHREARRPWRTWITRRQAGLLLLIVIALLLRALTYDPWVDGSQDTYLEGTATASVFALISWGLVRLTSDSRSVFPFVAALAMIVPVNAVHLARATHPIAQSRAYVLADDFGSAPNGGPPEIERWLPELQEGASAVVVDGRLEVRTPPNTLGFVGLRLGKELDPNTNPIWLPRGALVMPKGEVLEWDARVERQNRLAIILDTRTVRIEATEFGLRVIYLLLDGGLDGSEIEQAAVARGEKVRYRLERTDAHPLQRLLVNGQVVWARPKPPGAWEFARFGATRTGVEHGATLAVDDVSYRALFGGEDDTVRSSCPGGALFCDGKKEP